MNIKEFYALVKRDSKPDKSMLNDLRNLVKKYPFFQAGIFTYIKCLYLADDDSFASELARLTIFVHDRKALFYYVMHEEFEQFAKHTPQEELKDRTNMLINAFFETNEDKEAESRLEHAIVNSSMASFDYFSYLDSSLNIASETNQNQDEAIENTLINKEKINTENNVVEAEEVEQPKVELKHQDIIDSFISKAEESGDNFRIKLDLVDENVPDEEELVSEDGDNNNADADQELDDDFFFTQTLANIYIKQRKFKRAYEIIKRLSLNYPEKNIYFADQLSFLEKLIKNTNNK